MRLWIIMGIILLFALLVTIAYAALVVASREDQKEWEEEYGYYSDRHEGETEMTWGGHRQEKRQAPSPSSSDP